MPATVLCRPDGTVQEWFFGTRAAFDPSLAVLHVDDPPRDMAVVRHDGRGGLRPETVEERLLRESALAGEELKLSPDAEALVVALASRLSIPVATLRTEVQQAKPATPTRGLIAAAEEPLPG